MAFGYPNTAVPVHAASGNVANAQAQASIPALAGKTGYCTASTSEVNMENPTMLYRCPGSEEFEGVKCETTVVEAEDVEATLAEGWHRNWVEAHAAHKKTAERLQANEEEQREIERKLAGTKLTAVHKGRGKYDLVDAEGTVVQTGLTKEEALAAAGG